MPAVLNEILDAFYAKLSESDSVDEQAIKALRTLFASGKNLRADDVVEILSAATREARP